MLSKKNYLDVNKVAFSNLNKQQKEEKYKKYQLKFQLQQQKATPIAIITNTNNKRNNNLNRRNNNTQLTVVPRTQFKWSECLLLYAQACIDPFNNIQKMPCIPDSICAPSNKFRAIIDDQLTIGTEGVGFALLNPWAMAANDLSNDGTHFNRPLLTTTDAYEYDDIRWTYATDPPQHRSVNSNSPYSVLQLQTGVLRLVAAGMEIEYTGQLLDQSGSISVVQWDGLYGIPDATTLSYFKSNNRTQTCATSREARCYVRYEPMRTEDFTYATLLDHISYMMLSPYISNGYYGPMGIVVSGAEPGSTFRVRAVAYFEAQLPNLPQTPSDSDPIGFPAFQAARTQVLPTQDPKRDLWTILKDTAYNIGKTVTGFGPQIGTALGAALGNPAAGAAIGSASKSIFESLFG